MKRRRTRRQNTQKKAILASVARFRCAPGAPCDSCNEPAAFHAPLWAEPDPYLVTFWALMCEVCIIDRQLAMTALKKIRARGWARPGLVPDESEMPPRDPPLRR